MRNKVKLAFDELEKELTIITQAELAQLMGGNGSSYSSGLTAQSSVEDVVNYFSAMGFTFTQDSSGNYFLGGAIKIEEVTVVGYSTGYNMDDNGGSGFEFGSTGFNGYEQAYLDLFQSQGYFIPGQENTSGYQQNTSVNDVIHYFQGIISAKTNANANNVSSGELIANWIGGNFLSNYNSQPNNWRETCASSLSLALNMMGPEYAIPYRSGETVSGDQNNDGQNEWYFYRAAEMKDYVSNRYGSMTQISDPGAIPEGAKGFLYYEDFQGIDRRYDHIDFWDGTKVMGGTDYSDRQDVKVYFVRTN
ncbi:hypothetical protein FAZ19_00120 [Sphingobacterium alkalisoli]|uniref:Uncharacterized protein n=1 Tax=Sphingobacterium alkalisoli TaxID=1874115 RepID=A0A4U0H7A2_9SPHI|nr:T6SS effector amidase Tae4 family protein [Sphingobacterium alkalisoli]TJY67707.1 hypothetical protein FAZ19_00120 [Sphingobacterium alkalisoli]GGH11858.1 hypothetical protein GCM10011418_11020 [Sphingobacterium alkalisoli]